ncbi:MAG: cysteine hydrolase family protein [Acidobacteria bacterium]|nr:cysteine hydrolase family protein [Acidobacteriota bacterium]
MNTVLFDIDTQIDFLYPAGALYVPGAERIVSRVAKLNQWAAAQDAFVVSTADAHEENDIEFRTWPPHCVAATVPQRKPSATVLEKRVVIPSREARISLGGARQVILEKQTVDCFTNANIQALLETLGADRYVVYGVVTEICVRHAAFGLLRTGRPVALVTDAIECLSRDEAASMMAEFQAGGGTLTTVAEVTA